MAGGTPGRRGGAVTHGESFNGRRSKEYRTWLSMRKRCRESAHYVEHGVSVCARWQESFEAFLADVGRAPSPEHTLDRWPDPDGNYEPGNVRWATMLEQRHNRRAGSRVGRPWLGKKRPDQSGALNKSAKLSAADARVIRNMRAGGVRAGAIARTFNVTRQTITNLTSGRSWRGGSDGDA